MTIFDSLERISGYTYFGFIDHDEFLVPSENRTIKEMLVIYGYNKQTMLLLLPIG